MPSASRVWALGVGRPAVRRQALSKSDIRNHQSKYCRGVDGYSMSKTIEGWLEGTLSNNYLPTNRMISPI